MTEASRWDRKGLPEAATGRPSWQLSTDRGGGRYLFIALARKASAAFTRFVLDRGDKVAYLRRLGARIGNECDILTGVENFGTEPWLIEIGNRVTLSQDVLLITHDGSSRLFREKYSDSPWGNRFAPIRIHDNSFIGARSILLPDATIGANSVIGAGSVVRGTVPPGTVWAGVPARQVATLAEFEQRYEKRMVPITTQDRTELRMELTRFFFGEER
jgi:acetyltransferase-like isoleucine patch superfamily enzyme